MNGIAAQNNRFFCGWGILYTNSETTKDYVFMKVYDQFSDKGFIRAPEFDAGGKLLPSKKHLRNRFIYLL